MNLFIRQLRLGSKWITTALLLMAGAALHAQTVNVSTAAQLQTALNNAVPGQTIVIADGTYDSPSGNFTVPVGVSGTATQPITLTGSRNAVLTTSDTAHGYGIWLKGSAYWVLKGFTSRRCKNGLMIDSSTHITIDSVQAVKCGQSGIALRKWSSFCTVQNCYVDSCGLLIPGQGEGIYVGSAYSNWSVNTNGEPDTCNYNLILNNRFGDYITAENIDIKEGTTGGVVRGNVFNGKGLSNENGGDSWIDVKGNYWTIEDNTGTDTYLDGFQTHIVYTGWGNYNTFRNNQLTVNAAGYGIRVTTSNTNGTATGNIICDNNVVTAAGLGLSNVTPVKCTLATQNVQTPPFSVTRSPDELVVDNASDAKVDAVLIDMQGRQLQRTVIKQGTNRIALAGLATGVYYLWLYEKPAQKKVYKVYISN